MPESPRCRATRTAECPRARRSRASWAAIGAALVIAGTPAAAEVLTGLTPAQKETVHNNFSSAAGKRVAYTKKFDLSGLPHYKPEVQVSGTLRAWGANYFTDAPLASYWEEEFRKFHPNVKFDWYLRTSLHAIPSLSFGKADFSPLGRQVTWDEMLSFRREFGFLPTTVRAVTGSFAYPGWNAALGIYVNKDNPLAKLSMSQIDRIFLSQRNGAYRQLDWDEKFARGKDKNIRTWGQLGLTGEWADKPIRVHGYSLLFHFPQSITMRTFGGISNKWNEDLVEYDNKVNADGTFYTGSQQILEAVSADKYAIGYVAGGSNFKVPNVRALPLSWRDGEPGVEMTLDTVQDHSYPLYEDVFIVLKREPGKPMDPKTREFMRYVLSREGQEQVMRDGKYLPLTAEVVREELKKLD